MSRFNQVFSQCAIENRIARIPFLMLGYPTIEISLRIIESVIAGGADALELGIPFSDPIADGPIIQQASVTARQAGANLDACFAMLKHIRQQYPNLPIGLLVYANLVFYQGIENFYARASAAGVDAVLIPDVPLEECLVFCNQAKAKNIAPVLIATSDCQDADFKNIAALAADFTYVVTRPGVTGIEKQSDFSAASQIVNKLEHFKAPPAVFGFGISNAKDVNDAYLSQAKGAIIGSALIQALSNMPHEALIEGNEVKVLMQRLFNETVI